jgi:hypothetical protein
MQNIVIMFIASAHFAASSATRVAAAASGKPWQASAWRRNMNVAKTMAAKIISKWQA